MPFTYQRTIRFEDTDAAGVVYFANVLKVCHEAYEESLAASGINLKSFFSNPSIAIPIVYAQVNFLRPLLCGDQISVYLTPQNLDSDRFEISYQIMTLEEKRVAQAITKHVCIDSISRTKQKLPSKVVQWFEKWTQ